MEYENPKIPEGINVTEEHPLKEFFFLALTISLGVVSVVVILSLLAGQLVQYIPFELEQKLATSSFEATSKQLKLKHATDQTIERYLQELADKLAIAQTLPEGMTISVHYVDDDVVNAFATLGGNIILHRGLIEKLDSENALAMLIAHEIAHIKQRAPIISLGRGVTLGLALASISGFGDSGFSQQLVGKLGILTSLSFSRSQEEAADLEALKTLKAYYGHTGGAQALFETFIEDSEGLEPPALLSTHPLSEKRIEQIKSYNGFEVVIVALKPLPVFLAGESVVGEIQ